jgi:hypothetical protein
MHIVMLSLEAGVLFYSSVTRSVVVLFQVRITATLLQQNASYSYVCMFTSNSVL